MVQGVRAITLRKEDLYSFGESFPADSDMQRNSWPRSHRSWVLVGGLHLGVHFERVAKHLWAQIPHPQK